MTIGLKNMKRNRKYIVIIGEGLTEFYYFNSLRQSYRQLQIRPVYPHHSSSMEELELDIRAIKKKERRQTLDKKKRAGV